MANPLTADALVAVLRAEGVTVVEHPGWRTNNRNHKGAWGPVNGVIIHHTVTSGTTASVELCFNGHADLAGPLCHGVIAKDGTVHLVGNGRTNHAGSGDGDVLNAVITERATLPAPDQNNTDGNARFYGFECINLGDGKDPWPAAQVEAIVRVSAAVCRAHGWSARSVIGHKEWTNQKIDPRGPGLPTMSDLRYHIAAQLTPTTPPEDAMSLTTTQAKQLAELHARLVPYAGWSYKGEGETRDAYAYLRGTNADVKALAAKVDAQTQTITQLVQAVAQLAAGIGDLDPAAIVAELKQAIESIDIRLDIPEG